MAIVFAIQGYSQVDIQIGSGTTNYYDPLPGWFGWNRSAYLYKASEINAGGVINSISFQIQSASSGTNAKLKIYLVETSMVNMPGLSATNWNALKTGATLVYTNNAFAGSPTGWKTINLDLPFAYSGVDNLMVLVEGEGCGTSGGCSSQCYNHDSPATHWYMRKDSSAPDDNAGSTSSTGQENNRANIKFNISFFILINSSLVIIFSFLSLGKLTLISLFITAGFSDITYILSERNIASSIS